MIKKILNDYFFPKVWKSTDENRAKFDWLIRLRWIAVFAQTFAIFPAVYFEFLQPQLIPWYILSVIVLINFNLTMQFLMYRNHAIRRLDLFIQLAFDTLEITFLLFLTGGTRNPLSTLLFLHAGIGALFLTGRLSWIFFTLLGSSVIALQSDYERVRVQIPNNTHQAVLLISYLLVAFVIWQLLGWLARTLSNLSAHAHAVTEQNRRIDRLRAVGALASGFSHEFSTPLNTIRMRLDRMMRRSSDDALRSDIEAATDAIHQCEGAIRRMNDSRLKAEDLILQSVDLRKTISEVIDGYRSIHPNLEFRLVLPDNLAKIRIPLVSFTQMLLDLLDNAAEACEDQGTLDVYVEQKNVDRRQQVTISISDMGSGVPETVLKQLGEPFVTTKPDGTGLGLYNALTLTQALGGDLKIWNKQEGGAIVEIALPVTPIDTDINKGHMAV